MHLKAARLVLGLIVLAWSYFLTYNILTLIHATELMWFLYWVLVPMAVALGVLTSLVEDK